MDVFGGRGGREVPQVAPDHPMMGLPVGSQGLFRQVCVALGVKDLLAEPFPVGVTLPCHPEAIFLRRVSPKRSARLKSHVHRLDNIGAEAHAVEYLRQCVKIPLD